jgi:hypothetical protein
MLQVSITMHFYILFEVAHTCKVYKKIKLLYKYFYLGVQGILRAQFEEREKLWKQTEERLHDEKHQAQKRLEAELEDLKTELEELKTASDARVTAGVRREEEAKKREGEAKKREGEAKKREEEAKKQEREAKRQYNWLQCGLDKDNSTNLEGISE